MTATVSVLIDKRDDVLRVPTLALRFQPPPEVLEKMAAAPAVPSDAQAGQSAQSAQTDTTRQRKRMMGDGQQSGRRSGQEGGQRREWGQGNKEWGNGGTDGGGMHAQKKFSKVWVLRDGKDLVALRVAIGLNDARFTEVVGGEL